MTPRRSAPPTATARRRRAGKVSEVDDRRRDTAETLGRRRCGRGMDGFRWEILVPALAASPVATPASLAPTACAEGFLVAGTESPGCAAAGFATAGFRPDLEGHCQERGSGASADFPVATSGGAGSGAGFAAADFAAGSGERDRARRRFGAAAGFDNLAGLCPFDEFGLDAGGLRLRRGCRLGRERHPLLRPAQPSPLAARAGRRLAAEGSFRHVVGLACRGGATFRVVGHDRGDNRLDRYGEVRSGAGEWRGAAAPGRRACDQVVQQRAEEVDARALAGALAVQHLRRHERRVALELEQPSGDGLPRCAEVAETGASPRDEHRVGRELGREDTVAGGVVECPGDVGEDAYGGGGRQPVVPAVLRQ